MLDAPAPQMPFIWERRTCLFVAFRYAKNDDWLVFSVGGCGKRVGKCDDMVRFVNGWILM